MPSSTMQVSLLNDAAACQCALRSNVGCHRAPRAHAWEVSRAALQQAASCACYAVMPVLTGPHAESCFPAGVFLPPDDRTEEDYEITMGVNHFGPFYLTHLLLDNLKRNKPSRIINLG